MTPADSLSNTHCETLPRIQLKMQRFTPMKMHPPFPDRKRTRPPDNERRAVDMAGRHDASAGPPHVECESIPAKRCVAFPESRPPRPGFVGSQRLIISNATT